MSRSQSRSPTIRRYLLTSRQAAGLVGFVVLGLSPSFIDWQTSPEKRPTMVGFYAVALVLIYLGVFS